jgi:hypothetical protein
LGGEEEMIILEVKIRSPKGYSKKMAGAMGVTIWHIIRQYPQKRQN